MYQVDTCVFMKGLERGCAILVFVGSSTSSSQSPFCCKVDGFLPHTRHVNLRKVIIPNRARVYIGYLLDILCQEPWVCLLGSLGLSSSQRRQTCSAQHRKKMRRAFYFPCYYTSRDASKKLVIRIHGYFYFETSPSILAVHTIFFLCIRTALFTCAHTNSKGRID